MPIKKENKKLYPANWKEIRNDILKRAGKRTVRMNNYIGITFAILWLVTLYFLGREQKRDLKLMIMCHKLILQLEAE